MGPSHGNGCHTIAIVPVLLSVGNQVTSLDPIGQNQPSGDIPAVETGILLIP